MELLNQQLTKSRGRKTKGSYMGTLHTSYSKLIARKAANLLYWLSLTCKFHSVQARFRYASLRQKLQSDQIRALP